MSRIPIHFPVVVALVVILSCEKSEVVSPIMSVPASEITGTVVGWQMGDSMAISATAPVVGPGTLFILARGSVHSDGTFSLSLQQPPPTTLLPVAGVHDTISDTTARVLMLNGLELSNPDQSIHYWIMNQYRTSPQASSPSDFTVLYFYSNRQVFWRRTEIVSGLGVVFDLYLQEGWNRVIARETVHQPNLSISTFRVEDTVAPTWYIVGRLQPNQALKLTEIALAKTNANTQT
jgi:hypothetical protein